MYFENNRAIYSFANGDIMFDGRLIFRNFLDVCINAYTIDTKCNRVHALFYSH